jgi:hypothetical protein
VPGRRADEAELLQLLLAHGGDLWEAIPDGSTDGNTNGVTNGNTNACTHNSRAYAYANACTNSSRERG